ncbi:MAG: hypothetical protein ACXVDT_12450, partial [Bacteroidia bacterium]
MMITKIKCFIPLFFALFIINISFAQKAKDKAREEIDLLKNGALLIRLKTSELQINAFKKAGNEQKAEELKKSQEDENKAIIEGFKANFTFCPVYFFYSDHSEEIKSGNYSGLFDVNYKPVSNFNSNYLIGEYDQSDERTQIHAFFIEDKNYEHLRSPFPFLIKQNP